MNLSETNQFVDDLLALSEAQLLKVSKAVKAKEVSLQHEEPHFPIADLAHLDQFFSSLLIDVSGNVESLNVVQHELNEQGNNDSIAQRELSLNLAAEHGNRRIARLLQSLSSFKEESIREARRQRQAVRDELNYDSTIKYLERKRIAVLKARQSVGKMKQMLCQKQVDQQLDSEHVRTKHEAELLQTKLAGIMHEAETTKVLLAQATDTNTKAEDALQRARRELAEVLYDAQRRIRFSGPSMKTSVNHSVIGITEDGHLLFGKPGVQEPELTPSVAIFAAEAQVEELLRQNAATTQQSLDAEKRCLQTRSAIDRLLESESYLALKRLRQTVQSRLSELATNAEMLQEVQHQLMKEFGVLATEVENSVTGRELFARLLDRRDVQKAERKRKKLARIEATLQSTSGEAGQSDENTQHENEVVVIHRAVRTIGAEAQRMSRQAQRLISSVSLHAEQEMFSVQDRQIHAPLRMASAAAVNISNLEKAPDDQNATLLQDWGLQAVAEQLEQLEALLADGSRQQIARLRTQTSNGFVDVEALKEHVEDLYKAIRVALRRLRALQAGGCASELRLADLRQERDQLRALFLEKIGGRRDYPESLNGRQAEIASFAVHVLGLRREVEELRESLNVAMGDTQEMASTKQTLRLPVRRDTTSKDLVTNSAKVTTSILSKAGTSTLKEDSYQAAAARRIAQPEHNTHEVEMSWGTAPAQHAGLATSPSASLGLGAREHALSILRTARVLSRSIPITLNPAPASLLTKGATDTNMVPGLVRPQRAEDSDQTHSDNDNSPNPGNGLPPNLQHTRVMLRGSDHNESQIEASEDGHAFNRASVVSVEFEDSANAIYTTPRTPPFKRQPYMLQPALVTQNEHFGGHRLLSADRHRKDRIKTRTLSEGLPNTINGPVAWSLVPSLPSQSHLEDPSAELRRRLRQRRIRQLSQLDSSHQQQAKQEIQLEQTAQIIREKKLRVQHIAEEQAVGVYYDDGISSAATATAIGSDLDDSDLEIDDHCFTSDLSTLALASFFREEHQAQMVETPHASQRALLSLIDKLHLNLHPSIEREDQSNLSNRSKNIV